MQQKVIKHLNSWYQTTKKVKCLRTRTSQHRTNVSDANKVIATLTMTSQRCSEPFLNSFMSPHHLRVCVCVMSYSSLIRTWHEATEDQKKKKECLSAGKSKSANLQVTQKTKTHPTVRWNNCTKAVFFPSFSSSSHQIYLEQELKQSR